MELKSREIQGGGHELESRHLGFPRRMYCSSGTQIRSPEPVQLTSLRRTIVIPVSHWRPRVEPDEAKHLLSPSSTYLGRYIYLQDQLIALSPSAKTAIFHLDIEKEMPIINLFQG